MFARIDNLRFPLTVAPPQIVSLSPTGEVLPDTRQWIITFDKQVNNYRLTHSASALSGFSCTSSLTMNEKFQYRTRLCEYGTENFEFIVSERVQVNPIIHECVNIFIIQIEYTAPRSPNFESAEAMG